MVNVKLSGVRARLLLEKAGEICNNRGKSLFVYGYHIRPAETDSHESATAEFTHRMM